MGIFSNLFGKEETVTAPDGQEIKVPKGKYTKRLTAISQNEFYSATDEIERLAKAGNRSGINELEAFVKRNSSRGENCSFYNPGGFKEVNPMEVETYPERLLALAKTQGLFSQPDQAQGMLSEILALNRSALNMAINMIESQAGWTQARALEILFAHLICNAKYKKAKGII